MEKVKMMTVFSFNGGCHLEKRKTTEKREMDQILKNLVLEDFNG
jgi:hypothetical protein